ALPRLPRRAGPCHAVPLRALPRRAASLLRNFPKPPSEPGRLWRIRPALADTDLHAGTAEQVDDVGDRELIEIETDGYGRFPPLAPHWPTTNVGRSAGIASWSDMPDRRAFSDFHQRCAVDRIEAIGDDEDRELADRHLEAGHAASRDHGIAERW